MRTSAFARHSNSVVPPILTKYFGTLDWDESSVIEFPNGLPAFENETRFVTIQQPATAPLVFVQSLATPTLSFVALPVQLVDPAYQVSVCEEDLQIIGVDPQGPLSFGPDLLCLVFLSGAEGKATANLMAPILINVPDRKGVQAIRPDTTYSHVHPLPQASEQEETRCL